MVLKYLSTDRTSGPKMRNLNEKHENWFLLILTNFWFVSPFDDVRGRSNKSSLVANPDSIHFDIWMNLSLSDTFTVFKSFS